MTINGKVYNVGDLYTTHQTGVTGTIKQIVPNASGSVRLELDVEGESRWTTWKA